MDWKPISEAKKQREPSILAAVHPRLYPDVEPNRPDLERWNGAQITIHHPGLLEDGFDLGWSMSAPVGHGGFPDRWFVGWCDMPPPPQL